MFLDSSAVVSIISQDQHCETLLAKADRVTGRFITSPITIALTSTKLAEIKECSILDIMPVVDHFHKELSAVNTNITPEMAATALGAFQMYGKGQHKADLDLNQCFSYAVAKSYRVKILHSTNKFIHTDIS